MAITTDLATFRLKCRNFMATLTCIPDSDRLSQVVYLSQLVIGPRKGKDLAEQIKTELDEHREVSSQIESDVYDGAFLHDHVPEGEGDIFHASYAQKCP